MQRLRLGGALEIIVYIDNDPPNDPFALPGDEDLVRATGIEN